MKTLKDIIALRGSKYASDAKNPSYTEFWQGYFDGWKNAYRDLKEILKQNGFNLDVPVINVAKTNADRIRSTSDERLVELLSKPWCENHRLKEECLRFDTDCEACVMDWLKQPYGGSDVLE